jgi:hypothetical protein
MDILADQIATSCSLDNAVVCQCIWHLSKHFAFIWTPSVWLAKNEHLRRRLTKQPLDVVMEVDMSIWFRHYASHDKAVLVAGPDGFHESSSTQRLLILQIGQLWYIDIGRARRKG